MLFALLLLLLQLVVWVGAAAANTAVLTVAMLAVVVHAV
jgi:hypothetical protein